MERTCLGSISAYKWGRYLIESFPAVESRANENKYIRMKNVFIIPIFLISVMEIYASGQTKPCCIDTIYSKNEKFAIIIKPRMCDLRRCYDFDFYHSHKDSLILKFPDVDKQIIYLLKTQKNDFLSINSFEVSPDDVYLFSNFDHDQFFLSNNGKFIIREIEELVPLAGEEKYSLSWDIFRVQDDTLEICKPSLYLHSVYFFDCLPLYPNEELQFINDYKKWINKEKTSFEFSRIISNEIMIKVRYYSVKKRGYTNEIIKINLEDVCTEF